MKNRQDLSLAKVFKALSNESRLNLVFSLNESSKTWTELLFELKINPKSLRDYLAILQETQMVKKSKPVGFELTSIGKAFVQLSIVGSSLLLKFKQTGRMGVCNTEKRSELK